eukprot:m.1157550 g.1157550  ORF g.1157550 m.1157550 type:complete len:311 (+) comp24497_c0_seq3:1622-2554(+)
MPSLAGATVSSSGGGGGGGGAVVSTWCSTLLRVGGAASLELLPLRSSPLESVTASARLTAAICAASNASGMATEGAAAEPVNPLAPGDDTAGAVDNAGTVFAAVGGTFETSIPIPLETASVEFPGCAAAGAAAAAAFLAANASRNATRSTSSFAAFSSASARAACSCASCWRNSSRAFSTCAVDSVTAFSIASFVFFDSVWRTSLTAACARALISVLNCAVAASLAATAARAFSSAACFAASASVSNFCASDNCRSTASSTFWSTISRAVRLSLLSGRSCARTPNRNHASIALTRVSVETHSRTNIKKCG